MLIPRLLHYPQIGNRHSGAGEAQGNGRTEKTYHLEYDKKEEQYSFIEV